MRATETMSTLTATMALRLEPEVENRLARLARQTGRSKASVARVAILEHLQDQEDIALVKVRLKKPSPSYSSDEVKRKLGLSV